MSWGWSGNSDEPRVWTKCNHVCLDVLNTKYIQINIEVNSVIISHDVDNEIMATAFLNAKPFTSIDDQYCRNFRWSIKLVVLIVSFKKKKLFLYVLMFFIILIIIFTLRNSLTFSEMRLFTFLLRAGRDYWYHSRICRVNMKLLLAAQLSITSGNTHNVLAWLCYKMTKSARQCLYRSYIARYNLFDYIRSKV